MQEKDASFQISNEEFKRRIKMQWNRPEVRAPGTSRYGTAEEIKAWKSFFSNEMGDRKLRILDVGTGTGFLSLSLAELGHDVSGIDIADGMISIAKKMARERGLDVDLNTGDAESLDFGDESFDAIVSRWVLWTLPDPEKAISEWMRVLKPGGQAYEFGVAWSGRNDDLFSQIKRNLGKLMILFAERRIERGVQSRYGRDLDGHDLECKLPLHYIKPNSIVKEKDTFERLGFVDITINQMDDVDRFRKEYREKPLRYKLARGGYDMIRTYCLRGRKPFIVGR